MSMVIDGFGGARPTKSQLTSIPIGKGQFESAVAEAMAAHPAEIELVLQAGGGRPPQRLATADEIDVTTDAGEELTVGFDTYGVEVYPCR